MDLAERFRQFRSRSTLKQDALSTAAGVSRKHISQIECGIVSPTVATLEGLLLAMGFTLAEFFESKVPLEINDPRHRELCEKLAEILEAGEKYEEGIALNIDAIHDRAKREVAKQRKKPSAHESERRATA